MKKVLYLMRHGQTYANAKIDIESERSFSLTEVGKKQAQAAGNYLKTIPFDAYYTSTLARTQETLIHALGGNIPYQSLVGLNEMEPGTGESRSEVGERMNRICTELMERDDHHTVLAISHAGASYCFLRNWLTKERLREIRRDGIVNTIIFKFEYQNQSFQLIDIIRPQ